MHPFLAILTSFNAFLPTVKKIKEFAFVPIETHKVDSNTSENQCHINWFGILFEGVRDVNKKTTACQCSQNYWKKAQQNSCIEWVALGSLLPSNTQHREILLICFEDFHVSFTNDEFLVIPISTERETEVTTIHSSS